METSNNQPLEQKSSSTHKIIIYASISLFLLLVLAVAILVYIQVQKGNSSSNEATRITKQEAENKGIIMKVEEEYIYQKDYNEVALTLPPPTDSEKDKDSIQEKVFKKLITDSIILQEGQKEEIVKLDSTVFNSIDKDYKKRLEYLTEVIGKIKEKSIAVKGSYVALWFDNIEVGPLGYDEAKKRAFAKIEPLQKKVKEGKMTMREAAEDIRNDPTLAEIDTAYQGNAYADFNVRENETITFSAKFDQMLRGLNPGEITDLYAAKDQTEDLGYVEAVYIFGQVDEKNDSSLESFEAWLAEAEKKYEIIKY
jgi:hypothetical protein